MQDQIGESAYRAQQAIERGTAPVVGVNVFADERGAEIPIQRIDPNVEREQIERVRAVRAARDPVRWESALAAVRRAAEGTANVMPVLIDAVDAGATVGEIAGVLRAVFGTHVATERTA
jgi:methylmalonyl-CoA mutase N-terminal domain/subunit